MPDSPADLYAASSDYAKPTVITQYTDKGRAKHQVDCLRLGPLAISETMLFALEGEYVQGFVYLADIRGVKIEKRRSFKHPTIGMIVGIAFLFLPPFLIAAAFGEAAWAPKGDLFICSEGFLMVVGAFLLWEVIRNRQVDFIVIQTKDEARSFELHGELPPTLPALVEQLNFASSSQKVDVPNPPMAL